MDYFLTLAIFMAIGAVLSMSLNLVMGYTGQVTIAHAGFMAVGAYASAVIAMRLEIDMVWAIVAGAVFTAVVAIVFGLATASTDGDEFTLASFALQMVIIEAISRWTSVTRGTYGLAGVPRPTLGGGPMYDLPQFTAVIMVFAGISAIVLFYLGRSQFGLALRGMRESEPSMRALGRNTTRLRIVAIVISAAFAGVAGGLQATMIGFLSPDAFGIMVSVVAIAYLVVGGLGNMVGALLGAVVLLSVPEVINSFELVPTNLAGPVDQIIYGVVLLLFISLRPSGILPERPVIRLGRRRDRGGTGADRHGSPDGSGTAAGASVPSGSTTAGATQ